ncbi:unnamed protein product [Paramecium pentaurelia]|uniref:Uncharacterized protein n=1 Tax=Paramecium pentaurelia TaxID=43138 RepID=A0A8S1WAG2_9CILI|nr:unnamed protein product [Paramecium pentaurelia]
MILKYQSINKYKTNIKERFSNTVGPLNQIENNLLNACLKKMNYLIFNKNYFNINYTMQQIIQTINVLKVSKANLMNRCVFKMQEIRLQFFKNYFNILYRKNYCECIIKQLLIMADQKQQLFLKQLTVNMQSLQRYIQKETNEQREKCYQIYLQSNENYDEYYKCIQQLQTKRKTVDRNYESMVKYWPFWTQTCFEKSETNDQILNCQKHTTESLTNFLQNSIYQLQI